MKRFFLLLFALVLVLSLCSCSLLSTKLFGGEEDDTPADTSTGETEDKQDDTQPDEKNDDKQEDPNDQETDPSGELPFEILPSDEDPVEGDDAGQDVSEEDSSQPKPIGSTDPAHVHVFDHQVIADIYETEPGTGIYFYSCLCGASGNEATFEHHHVFQKFVIAKYNVANVLGKDEASVDDEYRYYLSCECGKRGNNTFDTRYDHDYIEVSENNVEVGADNTNNYGELVDGTPID